MSNARKHHGLYVIACASFALLLTGGAQAQVNVLTAHNDITRTGQNLNETVLTPANVSSGQFGKLFSLSVSGAVYAQPLYVGNVTIPGKGVHNVVYVATTLDNVVAFDANTNSGIDASPLWQVSLLTNTAPAGTYSAFWGVVGTPVIDLPSNTMYLVSSETQGSNYVSRLHALDITTGAEKFGAPYVIQGSVPGTGNGSTGGFLSYDPQYQLQRSGLLLLNGVLYVAFGAIGDIGAWHGWIFSYNAATLQLINTFCTSPNGSSNGIWMGGAALAAEVNNPAKPYGRMFLATGNGTFDPTTGSYGMSVLDLDLTGGVPTVEDYFTPYNQALLDSQDGDLGSGGPILLPTQTLASGKILNPLVEIGKTGMIYILDRDNNNDGSNNPATEYSPAGLGGFNTSTDQPVQELQTPQSGSINWGRGVWGTEAYWNNHIFAGGTNPGAGVDQFTGSGSMAAYSFVNGVLSVNPTSQTALQFQFPGPTPVISANGTTNGIVWALKNDGYSTSTAGVLLAYDATNLGNLLFSSNTIPSRDGLSVPTQFAVPTVANGYVYVGTDNQLSVFGLLGASATVLPPVITPPGATFTTSQTVTITDGTPGSQIYYTTDGSTPTVSPNLLYTGPIAVTSNITINAIGSATGYLQSPPTSATFVAGSSASTPVFSLAAGTYTSAKTLTITDATAGAVIYYTFDGTTPTTASPVYSGPLNIPVSETIQAIAIAPKSLPSSVVSAAYIIATNYAINFQQGFSSAQASGLMQFNGSTDLDDLRLQLTSGGQNQAGSAFFTTPVNVQAFTTDFSLQLSNPVADGMTFTIQNSGPGALGGSGGSLGYQGLQKSLAIKFDLYNNAGEGPDSTGIFTGGSDPTIASSIDLSNTGINLHDGSVMNVHLTYDGTVLNMTIYDTVTFATWSHSFTVNIPAAVGGNTAYVGFTGGTGGGSASQKLTYWTYVQGLPSVPSYPAGFDTTGISTNGVAALNTAAHSLVLTNGGQYQAASAYYSTPVGINTFTTDFDFTIGPGNFPGVADGMTFVIQNNSATTLEGSGGTLGYAQIPNSVAIKFDLYNSSGEGSDSTGVFVNGTTPTIPAIDLTPSGVILTSGDNIHAHITYDGIALTWTLTDTTAASKPTVTNFVALNIPGIVGANTAYMGFTAGTGGGTAVQTVSDWTFSNTVPSVPPAVPTFSHSITTASGLSLNGTAALNPTGAGIVLTPGGQYQAGSVFFSTPVYVQGFTTDFDFIIGAGINSSLGDGLTFVVQNAGTTALGASGGNMGYGTINTSVAIKFDTYNGAGEGSDSTGVFVNGATPSIPAIDLTSSGVILGSGDNIHAHVTYNGSAITWTLTDTTLPSMPSATNAFTVNIPAVVGSNYAYIGFTAGTGGSTATPTVLDWTFKNF